MVADRTRDLLFPLTILVSVAVGAVIGGVFQRSGGDGRSASLTPASDTDSVVNAIDALRAELVQVRKLIESGSMQSAPVDRGDSRSPAAPDITADMRKATTEILQATDSLLTAAMRSGGGRAPLAVPAKVDPAVWTELDSRSFEANMKSFILWDYQQVLDRFGAPDAVYKSDSGITWKYQRGPRRSTYFRYIEGQLVAVQTEG